MRLRVLTPQGVAFEGEVEAVQAPLADGWIGILPGHSPFVAGLMRGQVAFREHAATRVLATIGGSLEVAGDLVTLLTGFAALDQTFTDMEQSLGAEAERIRSLEGEAERQFDRIYRALADTLRTDVSRRT